MLGIFWLGGLWRWCFNTRKSFYHYKISCFHFICLCISVVTLISIFRSATSRCDCLKRHQILNTLCRNIHLTIATKTNIAKRGSIRPRKECSGSAAGPGRITTSEQLVHGTGGGGGTRSYPDSRKVGRNLLRSALVGDRPLGIRGRHKLRTLPLKKQ
jgi:hypothetical protein